MGAGVGSVGDAGTGAEGVNNEEEDGGGGWNGKRMGSGMRSRMGSGSWRT